MFNIHIKAIVIIVQLDETHFKVLTESGWEELIENLHNSQPNHVLILFCQADALFDFAVITDAKVDGATSSAVQKGIKFFRPHIRSDFFANGISCD